MPIRLGSAAPIDIRLGAAPLQEARLGSQLLWSRASGSLRDDFLTEGSLFSNPAWIDYGPGVDPVRATVENGSLRLAIADIYLSTPFTISRARYNAARTAGDDGYVEVGIAAAGDPDPQFYTDVFRRMSNNAYSHGVGMRFSASTVRVVAKVGGNDSLQGSVASYGAGDKMRLVQFGNVHTVLRNGTNVAEWADDSGIAAVGAGYRSIGLSVSGDKPIFFFLPGPRRFSAALDFIEAR